MKRDAHKEWPSGQVAEWPSAGSRRPLLLLAAVALLVTCLAGCAGQRPDQFLTGSLAEMFEPMFPPKPGEVAREAFDPANADKRRRAIGLLSSATFGGEEDYVRLYRVAATTDLDNTVRAAALNALGRHGKPEDVQIIVSSLDPKEPTFVRWQAAMALQKLHHPDAVRPLIRAMADDPDKDVRMAAATALGQYPQPLVFDALVGAMNDNRFAVVHQAWESLRTLTGQDLEMNAGVWLRWGEANRANLFAQQRTYVWQPYQKPRGFFDKVKFWKKHETVPPRTPTGVATNDAPAAEAL